jgi:chemotaxis protein methyltransferase CheR
MNNSIFSTILPQLSERTFRRFTELIYLETGICMRESKRILVSNRLRKRILALKMGSYDEYFRFLTENEKGKEELPNFIDAVSTNETYFYRGDNQFQALEEVVLPELFKKRKRIKVWSAGCSTGEEAYTVCIVILEAAGTYWGGEVEIMGTDINTDVVKKAREARYSGRTLRFLPTELLNKYFEYTNNGIYELKSRVKSLVQFRTHNLLKDDPPGSSFDIIFCRNVMIYFDKQTQKKLVDTMFAKSLLPAGYLFIGHSESLLGWSERFKYAQILKAPIYRLK